MMVERLLISYLGRSGEGVAVTPAGLLHVPGALPGETVEVELDDRARARLLKVASASPQRSVPICSHFGVCGGCAVQHLASTAYRDWKRALVIEALAQAGLETQ